MPLKEKAKQTAIHEAFQQKTLGLMQIATVLFFKPTDSINQILHAMQSNAIGSVVIQDAQGLQGIFTERDFMDRIIRKGGPVDLAAPISSVMTAKPFFLTPADSLETAVNLMVKHDFRHIPVVAGPKDPIRIISIRDIIDELTSLPEDLLTDTVASLPPAAPITVKLSDHLEHVISVMNQKTLGCVLVMDGKNLKGIFTERDVLLQLARSTVKQSESRVENFMTPDPEAIEATESIFVALQIMSDGGFRHLSVTTKGALTGVLSVRDILRYIWS